MAAKKSAKRPAKKTKTTKKAGKTAKKSAKRKAKKPAKKAASKAPRRAAAKRPSGGRAKPAPKAAPPAGVPSMLGGAPTSSHGLDDAEEGGQPHDELTGWKGDFWKSLPPPDDPFTIARDRVPVVFEPGARIRYSNPAFAMMTYAVTAALRDAPHKDIRTLLRDRVMRPIGVPDDGWSCGYGKAPVVDGLTLVASWGGGAFTARALARVGGQVVWAGRCTPALIGPDGGEWDLAAIVEYPSRAAFLEHCGDMLDLVLEDLELVYA